MNKSTNTKYTFEPQTFNFDTEVKIGIGLDKITLTSSNGNSSIQSQNFDNFTFVEHYETSLSPAGLWFRCVGVSIVILIIGMFKFDDYQLMPFFLFLVGVNFILFLLMMFDSMLNTNLYRKVIHKYFSNHGYLITIGNQSGNNIEFVSNDNEMDKIKKLESSLNKLKNEVEKKSTPLEKPNVTTTSNLDEIKKLGELYKNGILTEEEFKNKKEQLLK
ncbi:SHOCT domain-containing protein [Gelidibacter sp. F2691]|nr:SHOCT domain-containing protein [Gelidibacter sp. F2691]